MVGWVGGAGRERGSYTKVDAHPRVGGAATPSAVSLGDLMRELSLSTLLITTMGRRPLAAGGCAGAADRRAARRVCRAVRFDGARRFNRAALRSRDASISQRFDCATLRSRDASIAQRVDCAVFDAQRLDARLR